MRRGVRPTVVIACVVVVAFSAVIFVIKHGSLGLGPHRTGNPSPHAVWTPPPANVPSSSGSANVGPGERSVQPFRPVKRLKVSKVLLRDGSVAEVREGRAKLGDPGVVAELYEDAPPEAVERLHHILASGSDERPEFMRTEKYSPEVYSRMRSLVPGQLGELLVWFAQEQTSLDPSMRAVPVMDWSDGDSYVLMRIGDVGERPVAKTVYGTVWADRNALLTPGDLAVWMAHRIAAGDTGLRLPSIPPKGFRDWESWVRFHLTEEGARKLEEIGLLPKRG